MTKTMTKPAPASLGEISAKKFKKLIEYCEFYFHNIGFFVGKKIKLDEEGLTFLSKYYEGYDGNFRVTRITPTHDNVTFTVTLKKSSSMKFNKTFVNSFTLIGVRIKDYGKLFKEDSKVFYNKDLKIFRNPH